MHSEEPFLLPALVAQVLALTSEPGHFLTHWRASIAIACAVPAALLIIHLSLGSLYRWAFRKYGKTPATAGTFLAFVALILFVFGFPPMQKLVLFTISAAFVIAGVAIRRRRPAAEGAETEWNPDEGEHPNSDANDAGSDERGGPDSTSG